MVEWNFDKWNLSAMRCFHPVFWWGGGRGRGEMVNREVEREKERGRKIEREIERRKGKQARRS